MRAADFVESYFDAWNHYDAEGIADHLAVDGIYCDVPENMQRSRDELIAVLDGFFSNYRHRYELIGKVATDDHTIAFQYQMVPPAGSVDRQSSGTYRGAEFITVNEDAALTIIDYYDVPGITAHSNVSHMTSRDLRQRKYAKSGLDEDRLLEYQKRLEEVMQTEQLFLRSEVTLPKLAEAVGCSANHLSQVINSGIGKSFFDYLSHYRVQYAKQLLATLDGRNNAILNIAYTVGFNSNSAFYAAFKKCVGQTPAQYRKNTLNKPH